MTYEGIVEQGSKRASALGFPTINIPLSEKNLSGIYAAKVTSGINEYLAAAYADPKRNILEAYLLDFDDDLYGKKVSITLYDKIRDSREFPDDESLKKQIAEDVEAVHAYFKN